MSQLLPWPWLDILALAVLKAAVARLAACLPRRPALRWSICKQVSGSLLAITTVTFKTADGTQYVPIWFYILTWSSTGILCCIATFITIGLKSTWTGKKGENFEKWNPIIFVISLWHKMSFRNCVKYQLDRCRKKHFIFIYFKNFFFLSVSGFLKDWFFSLCIQLFFGQYCKCLPHAQYYFLCIVSWLGESMSLCLWTTEKWVSGS